MKQQYIITRTLVIGVLVCSSLLSFGQAIELSIEECRTKAIEKSELIKMGQTRIDQAEAEMQAAKSLRRPNISASVIGMYNEAELQTEQYLPHFTTDPSTGELVPDLLVDPTTGAPIIGSDGNPVFNSYSYLPLDYSTKGGYSASVSLEQAIYTGGKINAGNAMAEIGRSMAEESKQMERSKTIYETDQAYYQFVAVRAKIKLAEQYKTLLQNLVKTVTDTYETGMSNRNQLLKTQVQLNDAILKLQQANTGGELSRMALCRVVGLPFATTVTVPQENMLIRVVDVNNLEADDVTVRSEYRLLEKNVELEEKKISLVKGDYRPTVGVAAGYRYTGITLDDKDNFEMSGVNVIGSVNIPITTFGERKGKVASAKHAKQLKQLEFQRNQDFLALEMAQARLTLMDASIRIDLSKESVKQAEENLRVSQDNYEVGMETIVNLLEAQTEWQKAVSNKIDAHTDYKIKESNYLRVTNNY